MIKHLMVAALAAAVVSTPALGMGTTPTTYEVEAGNKPVTDAALAQLKAKYDCAVAKARALNRTAAVTNLNGWWGYAQAADRVDNGDVFISYRDRIVATANNFGC
jgi:hypothetical protein